MHMRGLFSVVASALLLAGCVDTGGQGGGGGDLVTATATFTGPPTGTGVSRLAPIGGMSGVYANARFNTRLEVALGSSAEAQRLREKGAPVYAYVKPIYVAVKHDNIDNKSRGISGRIQLPTDNFCDGYRVVLSPANGYRLAQEFPFNFKMMDKSSAPFVRNDWEIRDIEARAFVAQSGRRPFNVDSGSRMFDPCTHPGSKGQWR